MKVKMLVDAPGSPDGYTVNEYADGETYEVTEALGLVLLSENLAVADDADAAAPVVTPEVVPEGDDAEDLAESKKAAGPSENKSDG